MRGGQAFQASARRAFDLPPRWADRPRAYQGAFPITAARTLAQVDRDEADVEPATAAPAIATRSPPPPPMAEVTQPVAVEVATPPLPAPPPAAPNDALPPYGHLPIATRSDDGLAPEGTSGTIAGDCSREPANASQCAPARPPEGAAKLKAPAARAVPERKAEPRVKHGATDDVDAGYGEIKRKPAVDWGRVAEAAKRQHVAAPAVRARPQRMAVDKGPCPRCGVPGFRGCAHQLPYDEAKL